jgi:hypothetical protein
LSAECAPLFYMKISMDGDRHATLTLRGFRFVVIFLVIYRASQLQIYKRGRTESPAMNHISSEESHSIHTISIPRRLYAKISKTNDIQ